MGLVAEINTKTVPEILNFHQITSFICFSASLQVHVADLLQQVFGIMTKYKVMMDHAFASVLLSIFVLEGLGRSLDPNLDLLAHAAPLLLGS